MIKKAFLLLSCLVVFAACEKAVDETEQEQTLPDVAVPSVDAPDISGVVDATTDKVIEEAADTVADTNYFTLEVVTTNLTPREWLDESYKDYSGGWAWGFAEMVVAEGTDSYKGYIALRDEPGMYIEYRLIPQDDKLFVFRSDRSASPGKLSEEVVSHEIISKIKNYK